MNVFVIGATGFLGSHLAQRYLLDGHAVHGLSRSEEGDRKLAALGIKPIRGDAEKDDAYIEASRRADVIIHAPQLSLETEQASVQAILDVLKGTGRTFFFTSGTGVLGQRTHGAWSEDTFAEDDPFVPPKPILMRVETENLVRAAGREKDVRAMVIRPPMIWGSKGCAVINQMNESIRKTGQVCYIGPGLNLYSNVHVLDLVEVYMLATAKGVPGALYHAVSGELNYRTMAEHLAKANDTTARSVMLEEAVEIWGGFYAKLVFNVCSRSRSPRTRNELGWVPKYLDIDAMFTQALV